MHKSFNTHLKKRKHRRESDIIANADHTDDKEVESEMGDADDEVVMDSGFGVAAGHFAD